MIIPERINMSASFDAVAFRGLFPIFTKRQGYYLDSGATSLTPKVVVDEMCHYYNEERATVGRSAYQAAINAANKMAATREKISQHINLSQGSVVVFCLGATAALNILAMAYPWKCGDNVVLTLLEHNANLLPWMILRERGVEVRIARPDCEGNISAESMTSLFDENTRVVTMTHVSNVLGVVLPVEEICSVARKKGIISIIDGAQALGHMPIDLASIDCDCYVTSAHKAYGPTGIGFFTLSPLALEKLKNPIVGGGMVSIVDEDGYIVKEAPAGWEPGTPHVSGILGWNPALDVLKMAVSPAATEYVEHLAHELHEGLNKIPKVTVYGPKKLPSHCSVASFTVEGMGSHRVGSALDQMAGVMVRAGHHCAMLLHRVFLKQHRGTVRASLAPYNNMDDVNALLCGLQELLEVRR